MGSAMSSGNGLTWLPISFLILFFLSFLDLLEKKRGEKQEVGTTHEGWIQDGSMQDGWTQYTVDLRRGSLSIDEDFTKVGLTVHRRERSKSESIMCPSSLTRTFSGFRSR